MYTAPTSIKVNLRLPLQLLIVSAVLLAGYGLATRLEIKVRRSYREFPVFPDFQMPKIASTGKISGTLGRDDDAGQFRLYHFWATWCQECRMELPKLEKFWQSQQSNGLGLKGVIVSDTPAAVAASDLINARTFTSALDETGDFAAKLNVAGLPVTILVDRNNQIRHRTNGGLTASDEQEITKLLEK
jgi:thiol-disulfide isomerase/thioredoxin